MKKDPPKNGIKFEINLLSKNTITAGSKTVLLAIVALVVSLLVPEARILCVFLILKILLER